jgi:NADH kinase
MADVNSTLLSYERNSGNYKLQWEEGPRSVLIIKKPNDELTDKALVEVAS